MYIILYFIVLNGNAYGNDSLCLDLLYSDDILATLCIILYVCNIILDKIRPEKIIMLFYHCIHDKRTSLKSVIITEKKLNRISFDTIQL